MQSSYFSRVISSTQQILFRSTYFFRAATFLEQLLFQKTYFFSAVFFQNSYLFGAKLLPTSYFLKIDSSLGQLVFQNSYYLGRQICSEYRYLWRSFFFEADTSTKHQIFQNKVTSTKLLRQKWHFFRTPTFPEVLLLETAIFFFKKAIERTSTFSGELLLQNSFFLKSTTFSQNHFQKRYFCTTSLPFHKYTSYLSVSY